MIQMDPSSASISVYPPVTRRSLKVAALNAWHPLIAMGKIHFILLLRERYLHKQIFQESRVDRSLKGEDTCKSVARCIHKIRTENGGSEKGEREKDNPIFGPGTE